MCIFTNACLSLAHIWKRLFLIFLDIVVSWILQSYFELIYYWNTLPTSICVNSLRCWNKGKSYSLIFFPPNIKNLCLMLSLTRNTLRARTVIDDVSSLAHYLKKQQQTKKTTSDLTCMLSHAENKYLPALKKKKN